MADSEQKFDAAVQVIRSLPKSGSFQPSHEMMLKFYGYYKQAKEGPCKEAKPSFWDMVKKAKWEAWSKLGNISKEDAMENYVHELKEIIAKMPETDQASQFIHSLEPFYRIAYTNEEKVPPIFNIFHTEKGKRQSVKLNGHVHMNGDLESKRAVTSEEKAMLNGFGDGNHDESAASLLHNIETFCVRVKQDNGNVTTAGFTSSDRMENNGIADLNKGISANFQNSLENNHSRKSDGEIKSRVVDDGDGDDSIDVDRDDDDDDDLFCDSLGPEVLQEEVDRKRLVHSGPLESVPEDTVNIGSYGNRKRSSFSDVEIIEQFEAKNNGHSLQQSSTPHFDKITHVHFENLEVSPNEQIARNGDCSPNNGEKEVIVQPNQLGTGNGGGDDRTLPRTSSERHQIQRSGHQVDRQPRYGHRYRRRSQESDSDDSPGRSDHNSSSERDDGAVDRIAGLLIEIQDNMKKILERLKRVENSLQRNQDGDRLILPCCYMLWCRHSEIKPTAKLVTKKDLADAERWLVTCFGRQSWFENYKPSKTVIFFILWPFVVNIIFKLLQRRYDAFKKR